MTIAEHQSKMTVFYSKNTSEIKLISNGIQDMDFFGNDRIDYEIIYNFIVVDLDNYIINNMQKFEVTNNIVKMKEEFKNELSKYI